MLDSKKRLFVNIAHHRDLSSLTRSSAGGCGRKALQVLNLQSPSVARDEDALRDICLLDRVKDEEEEVSEAVLFCDQPTPVIEMKSFMSASGSLQSSSGQRAAQAPAFAAGQAMEDSFDGHLLQTSSGFAPHRLQPQSQSESLSTPVVDPNFVPTFSSHTLANMEPAMFDAFQTEQADFSSPMESTGALLQSSSSSGSYALQFAPPQYQSQYDSPASGADATATAAADQSTQLPESVLEIHRPSISVGPSESSSSSPPASPKQPDLKRKRSDSDCGKKGRMTKKQQFDALCSRKSQLEEDNFNLREKVNGYERACKRLKELLYNRIRQQRA